MFIKYGVCLFLIVLNFLAMSPAYCCTTAVISGKYTKDGRPLLWKNRDYSVVENEIIRIHGEKYEIVAVVNKGASKSVWMGVNSAGFCIENSVTKDLAIPDAKGYGNGTFMLLALQSCKNISEFEQLIKDTNHGKRNTTANYGVIDAEGGAAIFETGPYSYKKFDANDPVIAPQGIIVRSNFSMTGQKISEDDLEKIKSHTSGQRYLRANAILKETDQANIDFKYILRSCMRDMADQDGIVFTGTINCLDQSLPEFVPTKNTISRTTTVSAAVFHGVKAGEDPALTTMWTILGDPKFSVAVPCWPHLKTVGEELAGKNGSELCTAALLIRENFYEKENDGIHCGELREIWNQLWLTEDYIIRATENNLEKWRKNPVSSEELTKFHLSMSRQAYLALNRQVKNLGIEGKTPEAVKQAKQPVSDTQ